MFICSFCCISFLLRQGIENLVFKCLGEADRLGSRSVAFPALGTGNLGMRDEEAAKGILDGIDSFFLHGSVSVKSVAQVDVVVFDKTKLPKFQEEERRRLAGVDSAVSSHDDRPRDTVQLQNGVLLTIEQGDITADNSDVIVAPSGVVLGAVFKKSPDVGGDLTARYGGTPKPVADLTNGGKLACKRVFAISVPTRGKRGDDESVKCIRDVVSQCLDMANSGGHSSIAIPTIGTGGLGYTNAHAAAAIVEASKAFSSKVTSPSLKQIKVSVFDAHRVPDFQKELQRCSSGVRAPGLMHRVVSGVYGGVTSGLHTVSSVVTNYFTSGERKESEKKKKRISLLRSFSAGEQDVVVVSVIGQRRQVCEKAMDAIKKCVNKSCISTKETVESNVPEGFDTSLLQDIAGNHGVALKQEVAEETGSSSTMTLSGFTEDVHVVQTEVLRLMTRAFKEEKEAGERERILESCSWLCQDDDESYKEYDEDVIVKLEVARRDGKKHVTIVQGKHQADVDLEKMEQRCEGKTRKVQRETKGNLYVLSFSKYTKIYMSSSLQDFSFHQLGIARLETETTNMRCKR